MRGEGCRGRVAGRAWWGEDCGGRVVGKGWWGEEEWSNPVMLRSMIGCIFHHPPPPSPSQSHCQDAGESFFEHILLCTFSMAEATGSLGYSYLTHYHTITLSHTPTHTADWSDMEKLHTGVRSMCGEGEHGQIHRDTRSLSLVSKDEFGRENNKITFLQNSSFQTEETQSPAWSAGLDES